MSIEDESPAETQVKYTTSTQLEKSTQQVNIDPETGEERDADAITTNNTQDLRPRLTKKTPCTPIRKWANNQLQQDHTPTL